ncbi:hypothetical protein LOK49_LG06G02444 [Camellia lanceoleosa]|uniref:Uncharacterized protein n=1 Tax=Camellia lanceoleosa TaxID=1840588 RepID=A0ACC0HHJ9_9ERIC|nr:hypothetical protein LOK49_LG06G02444 [Camellia lanceoleosa]
MEVQISSRPDPNQEGKRLDTSPEKYGPWMTVSKQKRKPKSLIILKGTNVQRSNRFEILKEGGEQSKSHKAQLGIEKGTRGKAQTKLGFRYKVNRAPNEKREEPASLERAKDKKREEIRLGKQGITGMNVTP